MTPAEIKDVLEKHAKWLLNERDGKRAYLQGADLQGADLRIANLQGADLRIANLQGADLRSAYLQRANLQGAYLQDADLQGAENSELVVAQTSILADGALTVYKKACCELGAVVITLGIPASAKRSNATGRKCRAEKAIVKKMKGIGFELPADTIVWSEYNRNFIYTKGATVVPEKPFCEDRWAECASGIHFYITRIEAENN